MPLTLPQARAIVKRDAQSDVYPTLDDEEIQAILEETVRATVWAPNTAYTYGQVVVPPTRMGNYFIARRAGTSGATTPFTYAQRYGAILSDGSDLLWEARSPEWNDLYDIREATSRAWELKASKASPLVQTSADGQAANDGDIFNHCIQMSNRFKPLRIA